MPSSALQLAQQVEDLGLHGDVEGGGRLVGDEQVRFARYRAGDQDALRHAAGQLVRVGGEGPLGVGDADLRRAASAPWLWPRFFDTPSLTRMGSVSWLPMVNDGSRLDIGSWGM